jgi:leucyl aminopeptidase (aminopeptidase T)
VHWRWSLEQELDLEKLIVDVFAPEAGERVLLMVDLPHGDILDNEEWAARRQMAQQWWEVFRRMGERAGFTVHPIITYRAAGSHDRALPEDGEMDGTPVRLEEIMKDTDIAIAFSEYAVTASLISDFIEKSDHLRAVDMPRVSKAMEKTAMAADYREVARKTRILADRLNRAVGARIQFDTGHEVYFDLRHREAGVDDGYLHRDKKGMRLINLPSGEAFKVPYEGEREGEPSETAGTIPVVLEGELVLYEVSENKIVEVVGDGPQAARQREYFAVDPARRNIGELGLGTNDKAVVTGKILEDEKAIGLHWAYGRSEHLGGTVGPDSFGHPDHVVHFDTVYAKGCPVEVASLVLVYDDGTEEQIIRDGASTIFFDQEHA